MVNELAKNEVSSDLSDGKVSTISAGTSWNQMSDYKPLSGQSFDASRGDHKHGGNDFGKGTNIQKGTKITAMLSGKAKLIEYTGPANGFPFRDSKGKLLPPDYAVVIEGKDPKGNQVRITYGHLTKESAEKLFKGKTQPISVTAGTVLGEISDNSLARTKNGNGTVTAKAAEHHLHMKVEKLENGSYVKIRPLQYIKDLTPSYQKQSSTTTSAEIGQTTTATVDNENSKTVDAKVAAHPKKDSETNKLSAEQQAAVATFTSTTNSSLKSGQKFGKETVAVALAAIDKQNPNFVKQNPDFVKGIVAKAASDLQKTAPTAKNNQSIARS
jgi:hypothetical protein